MFTKALLLTLSLIASLNLAHGDGHKKGELQHNKAMSKKEIAKYSKIFKSRNLDAIKEILHSLKHQSAPELKEQITSFLDNAPNFDMQRIACLALIHYKDEKTKAKLRSLVTMKNLPIAIIAAEVLYKQGDKTQASEIIGRLDSDMASVRKEAIGSVVYLKLNSALEKLKQRASVETIPIIKKELAKAILLLE